jgi:ribosomal-protein-alanine N-acetyltransferase
VAETSGWQVVPLSPTHAKELILWEYPPPYERYSLVGASASAFTDTANGFVALVDGKGELVGYRSFGPDGRVPGGAYNEQALDTGGALRPELTGRGLGRSAIQLCLRYGWRTFDATALRVTVWSLNERALKVVRSLGFEDVDRFIATSDGDEYVILRLGRQ